MDKNLGKILPMSKGMPNITTVKSARRFAKNAYFCLTEGFRNPTGDGRHYLNSLGFVRLRHAVRAKLWLKRPLGQVKSVLDGCKPHGEVILFAGDIFLSLFLSCFFLRLFRFPFSFSFCNQWLRSIQC